jgi:5-methylcytosine-specific restriction protein B
MNTADRSLALMDTALRRRFDFIEMMPKLKWDKISTDCDGINLQEVLKIINERIEILYDREHTIGHSFLMRVDTLPELRNAFKNKILPLLEEYFYDDWENICRVLNDKKYFYKKEEKELGDTKRTIYSKQNIDELEADAFEQIYSEQQENDT